MKPIYLDYNATTPVEKDVSDVISLILTNTWGNPSSSNEMGVKAKSVIENARQQVGRMIVAPASTIFFTSGGTESNNLAIHSAIRYHLKLMNEHKNNPGSYKPHIITTNVEHDSIIKPLEYFMDQGVIDLTVLPVSKMTGCIGVDDVIGEIRKETCLVTVMMANNETGFIQPIAILGARISNLNKLRKIPILFHTDAAQAIGKIEVCVEDLHVHFLTIVGHKFYGPRIGALYVKECTDGYVLPLFYPLFFGGGQEKGFRPGTENTPMIAGLGKASELVAQHINAYKKHMTRIRDYLEHRLRENFNSKLTFNNIRGDVSRLPNTVSVAFLYDNITGSKILSQCSEIFASTGAACHGISQPSAVLMNSGVSEYLAARTLRLSVGRETSENDIDIAVKKLHCAVSELCKNII